MSTTKAVQKSLRSLSQIPRPVGRPFDRWVPATDDPDPNTTSDEQSNTPNIKRAQLRPRVIFADPKSLRRTLDVVRAANRTTLIRKHDKTGRLVRHTPVEAFQLQGIEEKDLVIETVPLPRSKSVRSDGTVAKKKEEDKTVNKGYVLRNKDALTINHAGKVMPLTGQWSYSKKKSDDLPCPWLRHIPPIVDVGEISALSRLSQEINAFELFMAPEKLEAVMANATIHDIRKIANHANLDQSLEVVGSRANGLATALSDIDLNLVSFNNERLDKVEDRRRALGVLKELFHAMKQQCLEGTSHGVKLNMLVAGARVPIISGTHRPSGLDFQIQCTTSSYNSTEYIKAFLKEHPRLRGLFFLLKQALTMRGLTVGSEHGLTSYPLLNMIIASLKLHIEGPRTDDVATQLLSFLDMYAEIDFYTTGITVRPPELIPKDKIISRNGKTSQAEVTEPIQKTSSLTATPEVRATRGPSDKVGYNHMMYLQDPADPTNNLGSNCTKIKYVQATIIEMRERLRSVMEEWNKNSGDRARKRLSLLRPLVGGDYRIFELDRLAMRQAADTVRNKRKRQLFWGKNVQSVNKTSDWKVL